MNNLVRCGVRRDRAPQIWMSVRILSMTGSGMQWPGPETWTAMAGMNFAIGAPYADIGSLVDAGFVRVYSGQTGAVLLERRGKHYHHLGQALGGVTGPGPELEDEAAVALREKHGESGVAECAAEGGRLAGLGEHAPHAIRGLDRERPSGSDSIQNHLALGIRPETQRAAAGTARRCGRQSNECAVGSSRARTARARGPLPRARPFEPGVQRLS